MTVNVGSQGEFAARPVLDAADITYGEHPPLEQLTYFQTSPTRQLGHLQEADKA